MSAPMPEVGGGVEQEKPNHPRTRKDQDTSAAGNISAPVHDGDLGEEQDWEEQWSDITQTDEPDDLRNIIHDFQIGWLEQLLAGERAEDLLAQSYSASDGYGMDGYGMDRLRVLTLPLLHATRVGHMEMLVPLLSALKRTAKVKSHLVAKDGGGRTVLHLAALSGKPEIFNAILDAFKEQGLEVLRVFRATDTATRSTVLMAAASCDKTGCIFARVLGAMTQALWKEVEGELKAERKAELKVELEAERKAEPMAKLEAKRKAELLKKDNRGRTLLHMAVDRDYFNCNTWGDLMQIHEFLTNSEVLEMLTSRNSASGNTVLMAAAWGRLSFEPVLRALRDALDKDESKV